MKPFKFLTTTAICFFTVSAFAQIHQKQDVSISAGVGLGSFLYSGVSLNTNAEYAITDELAIGAGLGYTSYSDSYYSVYNDFGYRVSVFYIGPRATYHFSDLLNISVEGLDLYTGAFLGLAISSVKYEGVKVRDYTAPGIVDYNLFGGVRYYFSPNLAVYGELGIGTAILQTGINFKF